jgi:hydrophobic/amphiphilic exporter-1 (mainly G- bacteria), HAE1 family
LLLSIMVVGVIATGNSAGIVPARLHRPEPHVFIPWQNAPTQEVLDKITMPLEEELSTVRGLDRINSWSGMGTPGDRRFKQGTDMDVAYREVRDRVQRARAAVPGGRRPCVHPQGGCLGDSGLRWSGWPWIPRIDDYYNLIKREMVQPLERIDGVANVTTDGLEEREVIIEVDRQKAEGHGLNIYELANGVRHDNFTMASGNVRDSGKKYLLRSLATYRSLEELENRPVHRHAAAEGHCRTQVRGARETVWCAGQQPPGDRGGGVQGQVKRTRSRCRGGFAKF